MKRSLLAAALLLGTVAAHADDLRTGTKQLSIFVTDPSYTESQSAGSHVSGGAGLAFSYVWAPRWSTQLSVAAQQHRTWFTTFANVTNGPNGVVTISAVTDVRRINTYPVELLTNYHFVNESRWTPFIGFGVRYVGAPAMAQTTIVSAPSGSGPGVVSTAPRFSDRTSGELAGGVALRITPGLSLNLEARRLLRSEGVVYDPVNRGVIGVSWKF